MASDSQFLAIAMVTPKTIAPSSSNAPGAATLGAILQADSVSCDILRFLLKNQSAMDTAKGIAAWWVHLDELAVQPSLHRLSACGAIAMHTLTSGSTLYGLTPDRELRVWLRNALANLDDQHPNTNRQVEPGKVPEGVSSI